ncbi:probable inorganic phosphate transporter 1-9 [Rutidosis leptorrhynchoides]|uniref:probable inorganic phosphate transporter 1-9 n=1 Tax=Rutidosis leptorrhynchoides TaxID=125765 RepID=UPI003A99A420
MALKVLTALDAAKTQYYHFKAIIIAGMGLFTDSYDLFCIPPIMRMIGRIYYPEIHRNKDPKYWFEVPTSIASTMFVVALMGTVIGQLVFGRLGDRVGRRQVYGISLMMTVIGSIGCGFTLSRLTSMVFVCFGFFRFLLGIGIGGDYPLSATIMSEFANKKTRGAFIAGVFSMQGFGILLSSLVTMTMCSIFKASADEKLSAPEKLPLSVNVSSVPPEADVTWRLILMIGAIPAAATYYWRMKMPETARFTALVEKNTLQAAKDMEKVLKVSLNTIHEFEDVEMISTPNNRATLSNNYSFFSQEFIRCHSRDLIAASLNWFLVDIVFYSLNLLQYHALQGHMDSKDEMNIYEDAWQVAKFQALVAICATIPGYFVTVYMIDYVRRVAVQAAGFFFMAVSLFTIAKINTGGLGSNQGTGFMILYGLTLFFSNFGPNTTTFIVPAELFPARFRATCHGISGAFGKVGAIIGLIWFMWASRDPPDGLGVSHTLMAMGGVCVLGFLVTYFFTRETMGRSLEENENVDKFTDVVFIRFWPKKFWAKTKEVITPKRAEDVYVSAEVGMKMW